MMPELYLRAVYPHIERPQVGSYRILAARYTNYDVIVQSQIYFRGRVIRCFNVTTLLTWKTGQGPFERRDNHLVVKQITLNITSHKQLTIFALPFYIFILQYHKAIL